MIIQRRWESLSLESDMIPLSPEFVHVLFASEGYVGGGKGNVVLEYKIAEVGRPMIFSAVYIQMPSVFIAVSA